MNANMTPVDWAKLPLHKYADFTGRAPRAEFWWYFLFMIIVAIVAMIIDSILGLPKVLLLYGPLTLLVIVATFVPGLAVQVRRLHDRGHTGWWLLAFYIPYFGMLALNPRMGGPQAASAASMGSLGMTLLLSLVVMVIGITLLVFYVLPSTPGDNRYGSNPYGEGEGRKAVPAE